MFCLSYDSIAILTFKESFGQYNLVFEDRVGLEAEGAVKAVRVNIVCILHAYFFGSLVHDLDELLSI